MKLILYYFLFLLGGMLIISGSIAVYSKPASTQLLIGYMIESVFGSLFMIYGLISIRKIVTI